MPREAAVAILFADVSSSTQLYETFGDIRANKIVGSCLHAMAEATTQHGGTVVKTIGDEAMCSFPTAQQAALAAIVMQDNLAGRELAPGLAIAIRIGFHAGIALLQDNDVFGDAVNVAARMVGAAKAGQILTTGATVAALDRVRQACCRQIDLARVKGKQDEIAVFELMWRVDDATTMHTAHNPPWALRKQASATLVLKISEKRLEIGDACPTLTIGRTNENNLIVAQPVVSRQHARLEYRGGRFVLTDYSTNGTYVVPDHGAAAMVHRDSVQLSESGVFGLGEAVRAGAPSAIRYETFG